MICQIALSPKEINDHLFVRQTVFVTEQNIDPSLEYDFLDEHSVLFVGYKNTTPIGSIRLRIIDDCAKIERVAIIKEYRKLGYGFILVKTAEEYALKHFKIIKFILNAQKNTILFYEKCGYIKIGDIFLEADIPHMKMLKTI